MKWISQMTLRELQEYRIMCTKEMHNRGGDVFEAGTIFEVVHKYGGLILRTIDSPPRWIKTHEYIGLTLVAADAGTCGLTSSLGEQPTRL